MLVSTVSSTGADSQELPGGEQHARPPPATRATAAMITARTAAARTGSGIRGVATGSSSHIDARSYSMGVRCPAIPGPIPAVFTTLSRGMFPADRTNPPGGLSSYGRGQ